MRPAMSSQGRMRVMETVVPVETTATYTVVGAVMQSGAYTTTERSLPIGRLIDAAGGLIPQASPTLRIIRNREVRFQIQYSPTGPGANDLLLPGDLVVVPVRMGEQISEPRVDTTVPVACLGLLDRPVVLPLNPSITTVQDLARRLGQSPEAARTAYVIDPVRGGNPAQLTVGSVVVFDSRRIDRLPFQQTGFLRAAFDLHQQRTSAFPGVMPADAHLPPAVPPAQVVQQASGDMILPPHSQTAAEPSLTLPAPQFPEAMSESKRFATSQGPVLSNEPVREFAQPVKNPEVASPPVLPPDLAQAIELFAPRREASSVPPLSRSSMGSTVETPEASVHEDQSAVVTASARITSTASLPAASPPATLIHPTPAGKPVSSLKPAAGSPRLRTGHIMGYLAVCGATISILIGLSLLFSVVFGPVSSICSQPVTSSATCLSDAASAVSVVEPSRPCTEIASAMSIPRCEKSSETRVKELLQRTLPVVEEEIQVPSQWPLHGKVVGDRRLILNAAHPEITGPHFTKRQKSPEREKVSTVTTKAAERHLRNSLREICRPVGDPVDRESLLGDSIESVMNGSSRNRVDDREQRNPSEPLDSGATPAFVAQAMEPACSSPAMGSESDLPASMVSEFDIVQPLPPPPAQTSAMSPLERALRTLAAEKRG